MRKATPSSKASAVTLPSGYAGNDQCVGTLADELQSMQLEAGAARQLGVEAPVEVRQHEALDQARAAPVEFVLQHGSEGLQKGLLGGQGLHHAGGQGVGDARQAQLAQGPFDRLTRLLRSTAEHLVVRCDGGRDERSNIVAACHWCNDRRHRGRPHTAPSAETYLHRVACRVAAGRWHPSNRFINRSAEFPARMPNATTGILDPCRYASF